MGLFKYKNIILSILGFNVETKNEQYLQQNMEFLKNTFGKSVIPCMITILSANINVFVDGILVGNKIGTEALAAINLSLPLFLGMCVVGSFITSGTSINAAREIGRENMEKCEVYYSTCINVLFLISILITVLGLAFQVPLVDFLCKDEAIKAFVRDYIVITLIGTFPKIMIYVPLWYLRLDGKHKEVTAMMTVMTVGNILLDILMVYIWDMKVFGAGLASVIATTISLIIGLICLGSKKCNFHYHFRMIKTFREWKSIFKTGTPSALNNLFSTIRLLMINGILMEYGGGIMVAIFSAINGIAGFGECVTLGIPQAGATMLGVYSGEKDNGSIQILLKIEWILGCIHATAFLIICTVFSGMIQKMYGLTENLLWPLVWLALSIFPALLCNILTNYYNVAKKNAWANGIIFLRVIAMTYLGLLLEVNLHLPSYSFLLLAEVFTIMLWVVAIQIYHKKQKNLTRFLLMDVELEKEGNVLNFSVDFEPEHICEASEKISVFCEDNGMDMKQTMKMQLAVEEIMTLISQKIKGSMKENLFFDIRAYAVKGVIGLRIRYGGIEFDPFRLSKESEEDDDFMGVAMIEKMVETVHFQRTFGVNTLNILFVEQNRV